MEDYSWVSGRIREIIDFCKKNNIRFEVCAKNSILINDDDYEKVINFIRKDKRWMTVSITYTLNGVRIIDSWDGSVKLIFS